MAPEPDLDLSFASGLEEQTLKEMTEHLREGGARVNLRRRPPAGPYASLEWLIPTAVVLWVMKPYVQAFSAETGKLHANALHKGLSTLWNKVFGPKPEIAPRIIGTKGKVGPEVFSHGVSVKATRNDGGGVTLLFPPSTSTEDFLLATDLFIGLMEIHYALNGTDPLTEAMGLIRYLKNPNFQALVYMNPATEKLELIDYVESSKDRKLITYPIG